MSDLPFVSPSSSPTGWASDCDQPKCGDEYDEGTSSNQRKRPKLFPSTTDSEGMSFRELLQATFDKPVPGLLSTSSVLNATPNSSTTILALYESRRQRQDACALDVRRRQEQALPLQHQTLELQSRTKGLTDALMQCDAAIRATHHELHVRERVMPRSKKETTNLETQHKNLIDERSRLRAELAPLMQQFQSLSARFFHACVQSGTFALPDQRSPRASPSHDSPSPTVGTMQTSMVNWFWEDDAGNKIPYPFAAKLEAKFETMSSVAAAAAAATTASDRIFTFSINGHEYEIDLVSMQQVNRTLTANHAAAAAAGAHAGLPKIRNVFRIERMVPVTRMLWPEHWIYDPARACVNRFPSERFKPNTAIASALKFASPSTRSAPADGFGSLRLDELFDLPDEFATPPASASAAADHTTTKAKVTRRKRARTDDLSGGGAAVSSSTIQVGRTPVKVHPPEFVPAHYFQSRFYVVPLLPNSVLYKQLEASFLEGADVPLTVSGGGKKVSFQKLQVVGIDQVQNASWYRAYEHRYVDMQMEVDPTRTYDVQRPLVWHGTGASNIDTILLHSLNPDLSTSRIMGRVFGDGAYVARESRLALWYASNRDKTVAGEHLVLACRILQGLSEVGKDSQAAGSAISNGDGRRFHSTVDSLVSPSQFCVFDANQVRIDYVVRCKFHRADS